MTRLARTLHTHYWLSALLLGCLVLRAFIPAGYMIDADATAGLQLKLCSGYTVAAAPGDTGTAPAPAEASDSHHGPCPFSAPLLALAFALVLSAEAPAASPDAWVEDQALPPTVIVSPSRLPRGPPAHSV